MKMVKKILLVIMCILAISTSCKANKTDNKTKTNSNQSTNEIKTNKTGKLIFNAKTIDGKSVDNSIFKDQKLTVVNIWATFCGPCINELPELQSLYENMKKQNINVIGVIADTPNSQNETLAKQILAKAGIKYDNVIPDENLKKILPDVVPTTLFIDNNGIKVGETVGAMNEKSYNDKITEILKKIK